MTPSRIELHIEKLVLEGFALSRSQSGVLQGALEAELARLLGGSLPEHRPSGITLRVLPVSAALAPDLSPAALGRDLARVLYAGMSEATAPTRNSPNAQTTAPGGETRPR